jgi:recombinational DNA repair ATPase RecF
MDDALLDVILGRLDVVPLADEPTGLLLAACEDEESLRAQLSSSPATVPVPVAAHHDAGAEPAGAYLRSITVTGFRGVGPSSTLPVQPGPGLTLIVGRNGSGKSSFAEALEVLLTGDLKRWHELSAVWHEGWRNLHAPEPTEISAELLVEDAGRATVQRAWPSGAAFIDSHAFVQISGEKRAGIERLGWRDGLETYRPFLSHTELEAFFGTPSHLYDLLASVLGLDELTAAAQRLNTECKQREDAVRDIMKTLPALIERLEAITDERAAACRAALSSRQPDLDRALAVTTGSTTAAPDSELDRLRRLSRLTAPAREQAQAAASAMREAADRLEAAAGSTAGQARDLADLLTAALSHYRTHGPSDCPVCGRTAALDEEWRERTGQAVEKLRAEAAEADEARRQAASAKDVARGLFVPVPGTLAEPPIAHIDTGPSSAAWQTWAAYPDDNSPAGLRKLADHIEEAWPALSETVAAVVAAADAELSAREDRWAPAAAEVASWCAQARTAQSNARPVPSLKAAYAWLKGATDDIRNDRLAPLADHSRAIWAKLRQESNIDLGAIRLSGSGPRRQADLNVTVDGTGGAALSVMSQGEVNALALSIFLPRATLPASPFRFLVIDDPVQAMDPAKVDGLASVLEDVSKSRQVIVFTHDDRLPQAVRRLDITAHILEVTRRPGSVVDIRPALTPVERQLEDAGALCADDALPENVAAQVVPGLCRLAVEAAFTEAIQRRQLRVGRRHSEIDASIEAAGTLAKRAALALFDNVSRVSDVPERLQRWSRGAADTYRALNKGVHDGHRADLRALINQTRVLTEAIRRELP